MATFTWRDVLTVTVNEMSFREALRCQNDFSAYIATFVEAVPDGEDVRAEISYLYISHSPVTVRHKDDILADGEHELVIDDDTTITLTLPMTRACLEALPVSLAQQWYNAAEVANEWLSGHFIKALSDRRTTLLSFDSASDSAASSA